MSDSDPGPGTASAPTAGERLRSAREARGMTLDDVSARTRVPPRHLQAIEEGRYADLPSPTYAVGFARAHARATGADDVGIAALVRTEVNRVGPRKPEYTPYEMADPARLPSRGMAALAAGVALALLILGGLWFAGTRFGGGDSPTVAERPAEAVVAAIPPTPTRPTGGQVTLAATDEVWMRVSDAADATLFTGTLKAGERFDVPPDAREPRVSIGRPDKLAVTLNGSAVPALGTGERPVKNVPVGADAIRRRLSGEPGPAASTVPGAAPVAAMAAPAVAAAARPAQPRPTRALTETQRANLESARRLRQQAR